jgi:elongation factor P
MDNESYEQVTLNKEQLGDGLKYLKENMSIQVVMYQGEILGLELPNFVELKVADTEPGIKGDTASGASKNATLETGAVVQVPLFINVGDVLRIDTRTGLYMERA